MRRRLWLSDGAAFACVFLAGIVGAAAGEYGAGFWHAVAALVILLAAATALLASAELTARRQLLALALATATAAPIAAALLLSANWKEHVSRLHADVLITATIVLLSTLVVSTFRLLLGRRAGPPFVAVTAAILVVDAIGLVMTWLHETPGEALTALLGLILLATLVYVLAPLARAAARRREPG